jgi:hypothetical protein
MSVKLVDSRDVIKETENASNRIAPKDWANLFEICGTSGCQLNCQSLQLHYQRWKAHAKGRAEDVGDSSSLKSPPIQKNEERQSLKDFQEWFTSAEIAASAAQGCGSCKVMMDIFQLLFEDGGGSHLSLDYQYSATNSFELRRRRIGEKDVQVIMLFQPRGMYPVKQMKPELTHDRVYESANWFHTVEYSLQ